MSKVQLAAFTFLSERIPLSLFSPLSPAETAGPVWAEWGSAPLQLHTGLRRKSKGAPDARSSPAHKTRPTNPTDRKGAGINATHSKAPPPNCEKSQISAQNGSCAAQAPFSLLLLLLSSSVSPPHPFRPPAARTCLSVRFLSGPSR